MITVSNDRLRVRFDRFDLDAYAVFLKAKALPETTVEVDDGLRCRD